MLAITAEFPQTPARSVPLKSNRLGFADWIGTCTFIPFHRTILRVIYLFSDILIKAS